VVDVTEGRSFTTWNGGRNKAARVNPLGGKEKRGLLRAYAVVQWFVRRHLWADFRRREGGPPEHGKWKSLFYGKKRKSSSRHVRRHREEVCRK